MASGRMRLGIMPGKCLLKKAVRCSGEPDSRSKNTASEAKRLHVNDLFYGFVSAVCKGAEIKCMTYYIRRGNEHELGMRPYV